jgi:HupE / UreJ protein
MAVNRIVGRPGRTGVVTGLLIFPLLVSTAHAHMAIEGAGDIANGALHPLTSPAQTLILVGLALVLGQQVPFDLKIPLRTFAPASAIALALTGFLAVPVVYPPVLLGMSLCLGALVGLELRLPRSLVALLCITAATGIGLDSAVEAGSAATKVKVLLGTWLGVNAIVFYLAMCASNGADKKWSRTAIRVIGSWIVAISLMVLAFSLSRK